MKLLLLLMSAALVLVTQAKEKPKPAGKAASSSFLQLEDEFMKESLALSPVSASQAGYHRHKGRELDPELDDFSPASIAAQRKFYAAWQQRLASVHDLAPEDAADRQLMSDQIGLNLLELDEIQSYKHNPTIYVELIGNGLFLPLTQNYASKEVRVGHVLSRMDQVSRLLGQAKAALMDADPIFVKVAAEENDGNASLIQDDIREQVGTDAQLKKRYDEVAPKAITALKDFTQWLQQDLGKRPNARSWRLGDKWYGKKFKLVMETNITPDEVLANAERELKQTRAEMLELATPMHKEMYPEHGDHSDLSGRERENKIIGEVLSKIADDHVQRDQLLQHVKDDLAGITQFIRDKKIVSLSQRENLKVIPTPAFMRGIYSVGGFRQAPPLEPTAEAEYWVTPIAASVPQEKAESKLREYNNWVLKWLTIHEALPGHYIQFEHANSVEPETRRLLRALLGNGAYVEGWAEYVSQVLMQEGFQNHDPRFVLSMKKIRLRVLANAILDVRMQTMNMTDAEAIDLMTQSAFQTQAEAEGKLQRAKLSSAQLPTYYVGTSEWWDLRKKYQQAKGGKFRLMEFHDRALDEGPLPVPVVEKLLLAK